MSELLSRAGCRAGPDPGAFPDPASAVNARPPPAVFSRLNYVPWAPGRWVSNPHLRRRPNASAVLSRTPVWQAPVDGAFRSADETHRNFTAFEPVLTKSFGTAGSADASSSDHGSSRLRPATGAGGFPPVSGSRGDSALCLEALSGPRGPQVCALCRYPAAPVCPCPASLLKKRAIKKGPSGHLFQVPGRAFEATVRYVMGRRPPFRVPGSVRRSRPEGRATASRPSGQTVASRSVACSDLQVRGFV